MKKIILLLLISLIISSCSFIEKEVEIINNYINMYGEPLLGDTVEENKRPKTFSIQVEDEGGLIYSSAERGAYRYGPSIMKNDDGSYAAWFSSPGNNYSQWDYITYYHSDDGYNWYDEKVVLWPTAGSKDSCSVCDPGVIYFNNYYYLAYTSTNDANGGGANNSAFVARSEYPDGPFEKWNGESWGGDPEPIIAYEGDPTGWGIGEISFVIKDDDLFIYYTYFDLNGGSTRLAKADLVDNWPSTMRNKGIVCYRGSQDSLDVAYDERLDTFFAVSIEFRMDESSRISLYESGDGKKFEFVDFAKTYVPDYSHNIGIAKDKNGFINTGEPIMVSYAYGRNWGRWSAIYQYVRIEGYD